MNETQRHPPRTRAVAALDLVLEALGALRRLVLAPVRLAADPQATRIMARGVLIAVAAVAVGTGLLVVALLRTPDGFAPLGVGPEPGTEAEGTPGPGRAGIGPHSSASSATPVPPAATTAARTPARTTPAAPASPGLTADYLTEETTLLGYRAAVAITNPGGTPVQGWTVVITLPRQTLSVADVRGATVARDGATWTFQPDDSTRRVPGKGTVRVSFRVDGAALGATAPTGCTVDGRDCSGEFTAAS